MAELDLAWSDGSLDEALAALRSADPTPALDLVTAVTGPSRERAVAVLAGVGRHHLPLLRELAGAQSYRPERWLLLGSSLAAAAWAARGSATTELTSDARFREQRTLTAEARGTLRRAAALDRTDPVPWSELTGVALGVPSHASELADAFGKAVALEPSLYRAYTRRLTGLTRKWYGTQADTLTFARTHSAGRPDGDPLHALIPLAHIEGYVDSLMRGNAITRVWRVLRYFSDKRLRAEVDAASARLLAGPSGHPWSMAAHQAFAALYHEASDPEHAKPHLERGGTRPARWPWGYFGDPAEVFTAARAAACLP